MICRVRIISIEGLMNLSSVSTQLSDPAMHFYLCGPVGFMQFAAKQLLAMNSP